MKDFCTDHVNDFAHLTLDELGNDYHLGFKFEQRESEKFSVDPSTRINVWAEPLLILYVSVAHPDFPDRSLRYGLTRSEFPSRALKHTTEDENRLLGVARSHLLTDAKTLKAGGTPESARNIIMLRS